MYYPKSQIKTNLYTNGDEYAIESTSTPYKGYYYLTSTGAVYTGKTPDDRPNQILVKIEPLSSNNQPNLISQKTVTYTFTDNPNIPSTVDYVNYTSTIDYALLKNINIYNPPIQSVPFYNPTLPTQQNYQAGEFRRYFCKKTNEYQYIEINQEQFDKLLAKDSQILWQLYQPFFIDWQLTGDKQQVAQVNRNATELVIFRNKFFGLNEYLKLDFLKYYQPEVGTTTSGSYINGVNQGYVLDNRDRRGNGVSYSQNDSGSVRRDNSTTR